MVLGLIFCSCRSFSSYHITAPSPLSGLPEFSHLGWGHWFTLRDLELATSQFLKENLLGEGGYGVVYRGNLINGTPVPVKKLLNNLGQAKEFRVEVKAIGHELDGLCGAALGFIAFWTTSWSWWGQVQAWAVWSGKQGTPADPVETPEGKWFRGGKSRCRIAQRESISELTGKWQSETRLPRSTTVEWTV
ncbi:hypothetical protein IFM89_007196 [Coptis chinensis]|uniref:Uncharacterized protein n=1 Tax=Coptis chinensis TaxID=261450 RepID=A0A835HFY1_9MAGN|nr:hypothetical protein IFM89_007196 [Coptis chinensis]